MDGKTRKLYKKCPHGHALGRIVREEVNNQGSKYHVTRLRLFRHAVDLEQHSPTEAMEFTTLEGTAPEIECDLCLSKQTAWYPGEEAIEHLVRTARANRLAIAD